MEQERDGTAWTPQRPGWRLAVAWTVATALIGEAGGLMLGVQYWTSPRSAFVDDNFLGPLFLWAVGQVVVVGPALGLAQGLILTRAQQIPGSGFWALCTALAVPLMLTAMFTGALMVGAGATGKALGAILGLAQALVLRGRRRGVEWWPLACALAWLLAVGVGVAVGAALPQSDPAAPFDPVAQGWRFTAGWSAGALVFAVATAGAFFWLAQDTRLPAPPPPRRPFRRRGEAPAGAEVAPETRGRWE
jgi:hypothetical protein